MSVVFSGRVTVNSQPTGYIYGDFGGPVVAPVIGTTQRHFTSSYTFSKITLHTFVNVTNNIIVRVKINGIDSGVTALLPSGTNTSISVVRFTVHDGDYITLDVDSGTCSDLSVRLDY